MENKKSEGYPDLKPGTIVEHNALLSNKLVILKLAQTLDLYINSNPANHDELFDVYSTVYDIEQMRIRRVITDDLYLYYNVYLEL